RRFKNTAFDPEFPYIPSPTATGYCGPASAWGVDTENSIRIENAGFRSVREIIIVYTMTPFFIALLALVASTFRTRAAQQAEIVALRHQIAVLQQSAPRRLRLRQSDRLLWIWLSPVWPGWRQWLRILKPDTVLRWHRRAFARYWTYKSRRRPGRPSLAAAIRDLIQQMSQANFLWGAPRIHGELLKLGIEVAPSTVGKYLRRRRSPPSQTWRTFLTNHLTKWPLWISSLCRPRPSGYCLFSSPCRMIAAVCCTSI